MTSNKNLVFVCVYELLFPRARTINEEIIEPFFLSEHLDLDYAKLFVVFLFKLGLCAFQYHVFLSDVCSRESKPFPGL